jgi:DNA adenine methylase
MQFFGSVSLLRYPGGKGRLIKNLWPYFDPIIRGDHYAEPFAGGGSTFLHVARQRPKLKISINDKDAEVANFWSMVSGHDADFNRLCATVQESRNPTDDAHRRLDYWHQIRGSKFADPALAAFRFLFLNKTCWGGQVNASPMGGYEQNGWKGRGDRGLACQYDVDTILANLHEARQCLAGRTTVTNLDVFDFLRAVEEASFYVDPPYFPGEINRLYRQGMSPGEHDHLAAVLCESPHRWVLSYDNSEAVRELYDWAKIVEIPMRSSHRPGPQNWKTKIELLILPTMPDATLGECIQSHREKEKIIPSAAAAISSLNVMGANNASRNTKMNKKKNKSKEGEIPGKGSQGSNGKVHWTAVRLSTKGMGSSDVGKVKWSLKVLQENEKSSADYKKALGHTREYYDRLGEPHKKSFCKQLGLSVSEAEAILSGANPPASETAPDETVNKQVAETTPAPGGQPDLEGDGHSQPSDHEAQNLPEAAKPAPAPNSQSRTPKKEKNRPSTPAPDIAEPSEQATPLEVIDPGGSKPSGKKGKKPDVEVMPAQQDKLTDQERTTLEKCLEVIHEGMDTFVQVGKAIATIIVEKLYRETHKTFQRYADEVLGITPRRAYQLKDASDVIDNLKQANNCSQENGQPAELPLPTNENQVRALKKFSPDLQREIWQEALKAAGGKKVTGKVLARIIQAREKTTDESTAENAENKSGNDDGSAFDEEIEKVMATLNRAWKALTEEHRSAFLNRVSEWLTSAGEDSAS